MLPVLLIDVERPNLPAALAARGMRASVGVASAAAVLASEGVPLPSLDPACPVVVQVRASIGAGALLDRGADDVVLASDPDSLVAARLAAAIRRARPGLVRVGDLAIDTVERRVTRAGHPLHLLPREYALLLYMARHAGKVVDHATLHQALWGRDFDPGTNVIAVHVSRLRGKLGGDGVTVVTERGRGYRLAVAGSGGAA